MTVTEVSERGRAFIRSHEGNPLTCYLDPVKIPTIGTGFTMRSASVRKALAAIGITKLVPGKTKLTAAQSDAVFTAVLADEFAPAVVASSPQDRAQHQLDAGTSVVFNLGTGAMQWEWAKLWRAGNIKAAASYLASHYNTAGGKKLAGLVRRRQEEANLFLTGKYGMSSMAAPEGVPRSATPEPAKKPDPVVKEVQELLTAQGLNPGAIDGWMGEKTKAAVEAYQKAHPHLTADGVIGPATLSQLRRDSVVVKDAAKNALGFASGSGMIGFATGLPWVWIIAGALLAVAAWFAWRNRDLLKRRWNTLMGKESPV